MIYFYYIVDSKLFAVHTISGGRVFVPRPHQHHTMLMLTATALSSGVAWLLGTREPGSGGEWNVSWLMTRRCRIERMSPEVVRYGGGARAAMLPVDW